jgi:hypothetical protein
MKYIVFVMVTQCFVVSMPLVDTARGVNIGIGTTPPLEFTALFKLSSICERR